MSKRKRGVSYVVVFLLFFYVLVADACCGEIQKKMVSTDNF